MEQLKLLVKFFISFGFWHGPRLFLEINTGRLENLRVPRIRYPFSLRKGTSDIPTFYQVFLYNEYRITYPQQPRVVIDGGANIGLYAIKIKNEFPDAKVICVEPDPENFQQLQKNLAAYENVYFENAGLWNKDTTLKVYDKYNAGKWAMVVEETVGEGNVNAISLSSLMKKYGLESVDILKLDIETSEKQVFKENYEEWLPRVNTLVVELHDWMEEGCSKPFFTAVNKSFPRYKYSMCRENTIITQLV
jgi:FkbM family methyltransferase